MPFYARKNTSGLMHEIDFYLGIYGSYNNFLNVANILKTMKLVFCFY